MSYILDALKKAESERKLGSIPTLHAPTAAQATATGVVPTLRTWLPWLIALLCVAVLGGFVVWLQPWRSAPRLAADMAPAQAPHEQAAPAAPPSAAPVVAQQAPAAIVAPPALPSRPAPVPAPAVSTQVKNTPPQPQEKRPAPAPDKVQTAAGPALPAASTPGAAQATAPSSAQAQASAPAKTNAPQEDQPVGTLRDLPESVQRDLPAMVVSGYIYAKNPADRSVLINKKLLHEGEQISQGVVLERMTPKGVIVNYQGYRFRLAY